MAPKSRAKRAEAGAKDLNPKQTIKSKLYIRTRENDSKNTKRCRHCGALRSEDTETTLQDSANAAANVSAAPLDSIEPVDSWEAAEPTELPEWNGRRQRSGLPTRKELEVANFLVTKDFCKKWVSGLITTTMVQMQKDTNYFTPMQKCVSSNARTH